jgi:hypothetical protein
METRSLPARLGAFWPGLSLALLTVLFGQAIGIAFGAAEDAMKARLRDDAAAVTATLYKGDPALAKPVVDKAWVYVQRAHLHAGAMGTTALVLIVLLAALDAPRGPTRLVAWALGAGGLAYSVYWLWAGFLAPGLGSTGAAKARLAWLALPSSGAYVVATAAALALLIATGRRHARTAG